MTSSQKVKPPIAGFDWGLRRIGVSVSPDGVLVFPREHITVSDEDDAVMQALNFIREEGIQSVVIGLPISLHAEETDMSSIIRRIGKRLSDAVGVPVFLVDERYSTREAKGKLTEKHQKNIDSLSAQVVLQSFLDTL